MCASVEERPDSQAAKFHVIIDTSQRLTLADCWLCTFDLEHYAMAFAKGVGDASSCRTKTISSGVRCRDPRLRPTLSAGDVVHFCDRSCLLYRNI